MKEITTAFGDMKIERTLDATPSEAYAAYIDPALKAKWFIGPEGWTAKVRQEDFRIGGKEILNGVFDDGYETLYEAYFHNIEPDARIVTVYDMTLNGVPHSTSLNTVEFLPHGDGTKLVISEQIVFFDGTDGAAGALSRQNGIGTHLDRYMALLGAKV